MADMFPAEYQTQIDEQERKRKMAQMLFQQAMGFQGAKSQGALASRTPLFAGLANAVSGGLGAYADANASKGINEVKQRYQADESADLAKLMGLPEEEQLKQGPLSKFSRSRDLAKTLSDRREKRTTAGAPILAQAGDVQGALGALNTGNLPSTVAPPTPPMISGLAGSDGTKKDVLVNTGAYGRQTATPFPVGNTMTANLNGPADYKAIEENWTADLKERQKAADSAKASLASSRAAVEALQAGAQAGGAEGIKQTIRELAQGFGIPNAATAPTQELNMALGNAVLEDARKLAPVTNEDLKYLEKLNGTINSDPQALTKMLAHRAAAATKSLSDFSDYMGSREASIKDIGTPELRDRMKALIAGQRIGREVPPSLFGPQTFQIEMARQMGNLGYDVDKLKLPEVVRRDIKEGNMKVDTGGSFPTGQRSGAASASEAKKPKPISEMTKAERQAEIARLKKELGQK